MKLRQRDSNISRRNALQPSHDYSSGVRREQGDNLTYLFRYEGTMEGESETAFIFTKLEIGSYHFRGSLKKTLFK